MFVAEAPQISTAERVIVRFGVTFAANIIGAGLSFLSGLVIARGLGASGYGDLSFLLGSFAAISLLLEMGTSSAFYTSISRRPRGPRFFALYGGWIAFQFIGTVMAVGLLLPRGVIERVWVGHERGIVLLAFASSFLMTRLWGMVSQLGEAIRKTVIIQVISVMRAAAHLALVAAAVHWGWLTVQTVLWLLVGEYALFVVVLGPRLVRSNLAVRPERRDDTRTVVKEFATYCAPLVVYGWVGFLYTFADRWLLQQFGGSVQQGFFAVGQQFANISLIAATSVLMVFWKEIAEARERRDHHRIKQFYTVVCRTLYFAGAWVSCLLIPYSRDILRLTLGPEFEAAWLCLALMFLYPIHQSLGQVGGTFFFASGTTGPYARLGIIMMVVSMPVTYFVLAPTSYWVPGLELGAVGLAMKIVGLQIIGVILQHRLIARINGWVFEYGYQVICLALLLSIGWLSKVAADSTLRVMNLANGPLPVIMLGALIYGTVSLTMMCWKPSLVGLRREDLLEAGVSEAVASAHSVIRVVSSTVRKKAIRR